MDPISMFVLDEFRLRAADVDGVAARIVAEAPSGDAPAIPLLTSIDDRRDVATLRAFRASESTGAERAQHAALDPLVSSWSAPRRYTPRIAEESPTPPTSFRLAVTESGINGVETGTRERPTPRDRASRPVGLVWIGAPVATHAGLLVLLGTYDDPAAERDASWPLPVSRPLGVRIYASPPA